MPDGFAVFVLSYGRPDDVQTVKSLARAGYDGRWFVVVDDSDPTLYRYREIYGGNLLVFSKDEIAAEYDQADNFTERRSVFYARNACWKLAKQVGVRYFVELDDDYTGFLFRLAGKRGTEKAPKLHGWQINKLGRVFEAMIDFLDATGCASLAMSQGGDHIGGASGNVDAKLPRKAMNSFVCDVERPFPFLGRVNEDVTSYVTLGNRGALFFTYWLLQLNQRMTQKQPGGMTELYLESGTYVKSFYTVMHAPSCVKVIRNESMRRLHHAIRWDHAVPKIVGQRWQRGRRDGDSRTAPRPERSPA